MRKPFHIVCFLFLTSLAMGYALRHIPTQTTRMIDFSAKMIHGKGEDVPQSPLIPSSPSFFSSTLPKLLSKRFLTMVSASIILAGSNSQIALSDDGIDMGDFSAEVVRVKTIVTTDSSEGDKANESKNVEDSKSYVSSLQREKSKQEARKKSKVERSKDLCESLGRGC